MKRQLLPLLLALLVIPVAATAQGIAKGILLEDLTWLEAENVLTKETVVVIPLGAASKEHGPHLKLKNDWLIAEYLKQEVLARANVVIAPTVNYHYFPAFLEYPGSTSLRLETARDLIVDVCRSIARHGPRRFYVLNTGVSTLRALKPAAEILAAEGILLRYTNLLVVLGPIEKAIAKQQGGTHADEIETSMMLYMAPTTVDMTKAADDYHPGQGPLTVTQRQTACIRRRASLETPLWRPKRKANKSPRHWSKGFWGKSWVSEERRYRRACDRRSRARKLEIRNSKLETRSKRNQRSLS